MSIEGSISHVSGCLPGHSSEYTLSSRQLKHVDSFVFAEKFMAFCIIPHALQGTCEETLYMLKAEQHERCK